MCEIFYAKYPKRAPNHCQTGLQNSVSFTNLKAHKYDIFSINQTLLYHTYSLTCSAENEMIQCHPSVIENTYTAPKRTNIVFAFGSYMVSQYTRPPCQKHNLDFARFN